MKAVKSVFSQFVFLFLVVVGSPNAHAGIDPFIGEIQWFAGNFAPRGWAFCDGQLLPISSYTALFSILGTTYGGDGRTTFALPDVRGRVIVHEGAGPGLSSRRLGEEGGTETETLNTNQMPSHTHTLRANSGPSSEVSPTNNVLASPGRTRLYESGDANTNMNSSSVAASGGGLSHNNMQPYTTLQCIIALEGIFPSRS